MSNEQFIYLLPQTNVTAEKKNILVIEKHPGTSAIMTETSSIKQAARLVDQVRFQAPLADIIVDTAAPAGRVLLLRTKELLRFNEKGYDPHYYVSQLFTMLKDKMPTKPYSEQREFINLVVAMLFSARSLGGRRPCMKADILVAELGERRQPPVATEQGFMDALLHPLSLVPRFFVSESNRTRERPATSLDDWEKQDIVHFASRIATIRQSPFPDRPYHWLFMNEEPMGGLRSRVDDFIDAALDGTTRTRKKLHQTRPAQVEVVRIVDRLMSSIDIQSIRLFNGSVNGQRYDRIRAFLELVFGVWTHSLYSDAVTKPSIVNTSLLNDSVRERFKQVIQPL